MIKNFFYSITFHFLLFLLIANNFKFNSIIKNNDQKLFLTFEHEISDSTLSDIKQAKIDEINQQKKLYKFVEEKKINSLNHNLKNDLIKSNKIEKSTEQVQNKKIIEKDIEKVIDSKVENNDKKDFKTFSDKNKLNTIENSGLSSREKLNILSQLKMCYHLAINESREAKDIQIIVEVEITKDGIIQSNIDTIIDKDLYQNLKKIDYKIMIDNIKKTLDLCSPLRNLPPEKYEMWKNLILNFENK